jgi:hypothetical protein
MELPVIEVCYIVARILCERSFVLVEMMQIFREENVLKCKKISRQLNSETLCKLYDQENKILYQLLN